MKSPGLCRGMVTCFSLWLYRPSVSTQMQPRISRRQACVGCSTAWRPSMPRGQRFAHLRSFWRSFFTFFSSRKVENGDQGLPISVRERSDKQLHLSWMRAPVLAYRLPPSETEPGVCVHKDASPLTVGHGQLLMKIEGGFDLPAHRELVVFAVRSRLMCVGGLVAPIHLTKGSVVLVALQSLFLWFLQTRVFTSICKNAQLSPKSSHHTSTRIH